MAGVQRPAQSGRASDEADLGRRACVYIDQEHPEYTALKATWSKYRDLYVGGEQFKANASQYLIRREQRAGRRLWGAVDRVFYENYIGSIVDWFAATLFRREPVITFTGPNEVGKKFFGELIENGDRKGTKVADMFRTQFVEALITGASYVLVDFPRLNVAAGTRAEEDALGMSTCLCGAVPL